MTGSLQEKHGKYYAVICYTNEEGKRAYKWKSTGLNVKGNKKRAQEILDNLLANFSENYQDNREKSVCSCSKDNPLYSDFMNQWLKVLRSNLEESTYQGYSRQVKKIAEYFNPTKIRLQELKPYHIQEFYRKLLDSGLSNNSILHFHANIRKSLQYAVKMEMIPSNPADKIERPKKERFQAGYYNSEELAQMFKAFEGDGFELIVQVVAHYGFRRSEAVGLKWEAIDFEQKTITVQHKVVEVRIDGEHKLVAKDKLKNSSSFRTLPLIPHIEELLLNEKVKQDSDRRLCGKSYDTTYNSYIFRDQLGHLIKPDAITEHFPKVLRKNELRHIRFHDLRHSCASLLLKNGISMKEIQVWLGHSNFSTTADIYSHLDYSSKLNSAAAIFNALSKSLIPKM